MTQRASNFRINDSVLNGESVLGLGAQGQGEMIHGK